MAPRDAVRRAARLRRPRRAPRRVRTRARRPAELLLDRPGRLAQPGCLLGALLAPPRLLGALLLRHGVEHRGDGPLELRRGRLLPALQVGKALPAGRQPLLEPAQLLAQLLASRPRRRLRGLLPAQRRGHVAEHAQRGLRARVREHALLHRRREVGEQRAHGRRQAPRARRQRARKHLRSHAYIIYMYTHRSRDIRTYIHIHIVRI